MISSNYDNNIKNNDSAGSGGRVSDDPGLHSTHCIATDQTGKQRVMVASSTATSRGSTSSTGGRQPLRFIIMTDHVKQEKKQPRHRLRRERKGEQQQPSKKATAEAHSNSHSTSTSISTSTSQSDGVCRRHYYRTTDEISPDICRIGNPGAEDLNSFPIENSRTVTIAVDFVIKHMMPGRSKSSSHQDQIPTILLPFLQLGMQHEYLFESIVALALSYRDSDVYDRGHGETRLTAEIAYHYGRAMACLRKLLASPKTAHVDDAAIMTTIFLADLATKYGTSAEVTAHAAALQNMIISRGGLDNLGQEGLLKSMIEYVSAVGDLPGVSKDGDIPKFESSDSAISRTGLPPESSDTLPSSLEYPTHPYPPEVCAIIANLPQGFRELALNGHLSVEVTALIGLTQRQLFSSNGDKLIQLKDYCPATIIMHAKRYLSISQRLTESIVCLSVMLVSMRSFCYRFSPQKYLFPKKLLLLARERGAGEASREQQEHFVWTVLLTAEACQCQPLVKYTVPLMEQIFGPTARNEARSEEWLGDWAQLRGVMQKFLWGRDLVYQWRDRWEAEMRWLKKTKATM